MTTDEPTDDPYERHFRREPRAGAGVDVLVLDGGAPGRAEAVGSGLVGLLRARGREAEARSLPARGEPGLGALVFDALGATSRPLVLLTDAVEPWAAAHLDPLLTAIDTADHVVGRRPATGLAGVARRLARIRNRFVFGLPVLDPHSPCRLHRREAIAAFPLQSESDFLDIEILGKATFLGQLIAEVPVPPLLGDEEHRNRALRRHDFAEVFRHPIFALQSPVWRRGTPRVRPDSPEGET
jgi:hypothetical protein